MTIKQSGAAPGNDIGASIPSASERNGLEDLLLQSQSGLVMLREMKHQRERKWHEIAKLYGYCESPPTPLTPNASDSDARTPAQDLISGVRLVEPQSIAARLVALHQQRAHMSRVFLARKRQETESSRRHVREQSRKHEHAAAKMLVEAAQDQHRLAHAVGISSGRGYSSSPSSSATPTIHSLHAVRPADMEALLQYEHTKRRMALPFERLFIRMRWLCTSHRYHVRQRMLALFHQQRTKNAPVTARAMVERIKNLNAVAASSPAGGLVHCPLFVLSAIQLEAELKKLAQRHLPAYSTSFGDCRAGEGLAGVNIVELKVRVEQLFDQSVKVTAIRSADGASRDGDGDGGEASANETTSDSEGGSDDAWEQTPTATEPFFAKVCADSHWDILQLDMLESSGRESSVASSLSAHDHDIDPLLGSEWELLRLDDRAYMRVRLGTLARSHFERAQVDVSQSGSESSSSNGVGSGVSMPANAKEGEQQLLVGDDLVSLDAVYVLYMLRVVACRTKRHRLLRLLNYFHYIALSRQVVADAGAGAAAASRGAVSDAGRASSARPPHPASHLRAEKRQNEYVVVERSSRGGAAEGDGAVADKEVVLPAARLDLEIVERHMLRTASVFVSKQERASLPSLTRSAATSNRNSSEHLVMAIDRMQVICDVYDSELALMQAKLQLVQLLLKNGLEYTQDSPNNDAASSSAASTTATATHTTNALLSVFQRRPLIDFTHAYFYESYAAETLHLELQASLQQQIHDHFTACEHDNSLEAAGQEAQFCAWLDHQLIRADLLSQLQWCQSELIREATQRWFCVNAVGELHALHQTIYEQLLVNWKLIFSVELAATPAQCLEHGGDSVLSGSGWQLVFPMKLVLDCCRNVQQQLRSQSPLAADSNSVDAHTGMVATMSRALAVIEWHQSLGRHVYEAKLLERVYAFQYSFVREKDSSAATTHFFFDDAVASPADGDSDTSSCAASGSIPTTRAGLVPVALELIGAKSFVHLTTGSATGSSKTVPEWLEGQLISSLNDASHETTSSCDGAASASSLFLGFQRLWARFLGAAVRYQDLIGSEIFEFASCSPFLFLEAASSAHHSSLNKSSASAAAHSSSVTTTTSLLSAKAVQSRYAEEIAEKMEEEMQQSCYPFWISLVRLKEQIQRQFDRGGASPAGSTSTDDLNVAASAPGDVDTRSDENELEEGPQSIAAMMQRYQYAQRFAACAQYLQAEVALPEQLVRVNRFLKRFRGERALMQTLSPSASSACVFTPSRVSEEHDSCKKSTLTRWLTNKLQQLRQDLHGGSNATRSGDCVRSSLCEFGAEAGRGRRGGEHYGGDGDDGGGGDDSRLLLSLPSHLYLIDQFAAPLCRDPPAGILAKTHTLANEERVETLRLLGSILEAFHVGMNLIRVKSSFHFATKRLKHPAANSRMPALSSTGEQPPRDSRAQNMSTHGLLERWQVLYHDNLRSFHDRILESLQPSVASCSIYARNNADKVKLANRSQREALQVVRDCVLKVETELAASLQCMTSFLRMQSISSQQHTARQPESELPLHQREQQHKRFRRCLLHLSRRLRDLHAHRDVQRSKDASGSCEAPVDFHNALVVSSASELLQMAYRAPIDGSATPSEGEICAFWDALGKIERDEAYMGSLTSWMDLQLVFVAEYVRPSQRSTWSSESTASHELEMSAITALDRLWDRYELVAGEELAKAESSCTGSEEIDHLSNAAGAPPRGPSAYCSSRWPLLTHRRHRHSSLAHRQELMRTSNLNSNLPSHHLLEHRLEFLRLSFELRWLQTDILKMEHHYEAFLDQKKRSQREEGEVARSSHLQHRSKAEFASPTLLTLSQFYRAARDEDAPEEQPATRHVPPHDAYVVPATEMNILLQDLAAECARHHSSQSKAYEETIAHLQRQLLSAQSSLEVLQETSKRDARQEEIKRESFAIDYAYQLHFRMELLRKEVAAVENRMELERLDLQCQLSDEYDKKLAAMHAQLLAKQQRFDEFRVTMQHDLHVQLQGAQAQLVHQLVDHSGSISVETKASFLANLHSQHANDHIAKENVALKQTLLKLQSLLEMQRQTHSANHEREQALHRRHKAANLLLRNEAAQLQQHVRQLEADVAKASQEKTCYMLKWNNLQKQTEVAAQKKREAKIRALSAPYHRAAAAHCSPFPAGELVELPDGLPKESLAVGIGVSGPLRHKSRAPFKSSFDDEEEAFERCHEVTIRRQSPRSAAESERGGQDLDHLRTERHFHNSARHYQNEIRRLQQQLAKESKSKAALMDQVTQLRSVQQLADTDSNQTLEGDVGDNPESSCTKEGGDFAVRPRSSGLVLQAMSPGERGGSRTPSASFGRVLLSPASSPRTRAQSASVCPPTRPSQPSGFTVASTGAAAVTAVGIASAVSSKRPSTSFSPRSSSLYRAQAAGAASPRSAGLPPTATTPSSAAPPHGPATPARRFEVQKRSDAKVGGVAGVPNVFSVREPLPYR